MKKKLLFAAIALTALAGCTDESYVGNQSLLNTNEGGAISFDMKTPAITRTADKTGQSAATDLNNQFVVFGYKTMSDNSKQTVFNNYQVNYTDGSNNKTTTNSAGWEYVGYKNLTATMTGNTGVAGNTTSGLDQTIKYWDYLASNYKFYAYSLGAGKTESSTTTYANASLMSTSDSYTLEGDAAQLASCFISELNSIDNPTSGTTNAEVNLRFLSFLSKVRLGIYETIPGYSVKDVQFYADASNLSDYDGSTAGNDGLAATLYDAGATASIPNGGTYTITFDTNGKPVVTLTSTTGYENVSLVNFGQFTGNTEREYHEILTDNTKEASATENKVYIGRDATNATFAGTGYTNVLPNSSGTALTLKVNYTLVSRDGTDEVISVTEKTAKVPAAYTQWKPNFAYTYLFKLTDDKLTPITLDAVVAVDEQGNQETITTVTEPSITTFGYNALTQKYITSSNEYPKDMDIYATIMYNGNVITPIVYNTTSWNVKVYKVAYKTGATEAEMAGTPITETSVANAIEHTGGLIEATNISKTEGEINIETYFTSAPEAVTTVPAEDGTSTKTVNALKLSGIKTAGYYAIEYTYTESSTTKHAYKVIKITE